MKNWTDEQVLGWVAMEARRAGVSPWLPSVDRQSSPSQKVDRIRALELTATTHRLTPSRVLAFINGESTTTLQAPLARLLQSCYTVFQAQDMGDHVAVFDRVTDMRDAFGGVLAAMDELGIPRPKVEGAVDADQMNLGESDG